MSPKVFPREEVEKAFQRFVEAGDSADWDAWTDLHTEDGLWVEHHLGTQRGRDAIRRTIHAVMKPVPMMFFPVDWYVIEGNRVVAYIWQQMPDPKGGDEIHRFGNVTILDYAGAGLWSFQEDIYNPREAERVIQRWIEAGGELAAPLG